MVHEANGKELEEDAKVEPENSGKRKAESSSSSVEPPSSKRNRNEEEKREEKPPGVTKSQILDVMQKIGLA